MRLPVKITRGYKRGRLDTSSPVFLLCVSPGANPPNHWLRIKEYISNQPHPYPTTTYHHYHHHNQIKSNQTKPTTTFDTTHARTLSCCSLVSCCSTLSPSPADLDTYGRMVDVANKYSNLFA